MPTPLRTRILRTLLLTMTCCTTLTTLAQQTPKADTPPAFAVVDNPFFVPQPGHSNDPFPLYHNGRFHLFHMGIPNIGHYSTADLIHWRKHPVALTPGLPGEPDGNCALCTGCVFEHDGTFYCFYTANQTICMATSKDLDHWVKHPRNPVLAGDNKKYETANFRDPYVLFNPDEKLWWMIFCSRTVGPFPRRAGCIALAKSQNLTDWTFAEPLWSPANLTHMECPQLLQQGSRFYLTYHNRDTRYRVSNSLNGPWQRPPFSDRLGTLVALVASRLATDGNRWISMPFLLRWKGPLDTDDVVASGGPIVPPRQWLFQPDGRIDIRPADEIIALMHRPCPAARKPLAGAKPLAGQWDFPDPHNAICRSDNGGTLLLTDMPQDFYFEADITTDSTNLDIRLFFNTDAALNRGYQLTINPTLNRADLRQAHEWDTKRILVTQEVPFDKDQPIKLRLFRWASIVDIFIADKNTLTARLYEFNGGRLALELRDAPGAFRNITIRQLAEESESQPQPDES